MLRIRFPSTNETTQGWQGRHRCNRRKYHALPAPPARKTPPPAMDSPDHLCEKLAISNTYMTETTHGRYPAGQQHDASHPASP
jgi:hypothetical protein